MDMNSSSSRSVRVVIAGILITAWAALAIFFPDIPLGMLSLLLLATMFTAPSPREPWTIVRVLLALAVIGVVALGFFLISTHAFKTYRPALVLPLWAIAVGALVWRNRQTRAPAG